ncbi:MAG: hypothetical protein FWG11_00155 [Promicromonosporaceae bacterium]|nr:hypothetical protein [Promicromonosporaceae bacterium]
MNQASQPGNMQEWMDELSSEQYEQLRALVAADPTLPDLPDDDILDDDEDSTWECRACGKRYAWDDAEPGMMDTSRGEEDFYCDACLAKTSRHPCDDPEDWH